jgi:uncharacterized membrane protein
MEEQLTALSPLLVKVEVLLGLVTILAVSLAWLFLEILNYVFSESEETNDDWWEALRHCTHRRLIIPVSSGWGMIARGLPQLMWHLSLSYACSPTAWRRSWSRGHSRDLRR